MRVVSAFLLGAGSALLFEKLDKRRRRMLVDRSLKLLRGLRRAGSQKVRYAGGQAQGVMATARGLTDDEDRPTDDQTVAQRIRSDALRDVGVHAHDVDVRVERGIAHLSGSVSSAELEQRLVERVRDVHGVKDVSAELEVAR